MSWASTDRLVGAAVAATGAVAGIFPIFESDLFWHLASGRFMLEHRAIPRVDPFRFGAGEQLWVDHEWAFQLLVHTIERLGGLDGLIVLRAAALGLFAFLLFAVARGAGLGGGLAGLVALGATLGVRPRFLVRPEIATLFAIILLLLLLDRDERLHGRKDRDRFGASGFGGLVRLVALVVVWVNFHGEALLAPGLAFLFLLGTMLEGPPTARRSRATWIRLLGVPAILGLCLLVNPYGWRLIEVPLGIVGALDDLPAHNPEWLSAFAAPQPYLFGGLAAVWALFIVARVRTGAWVALPWALPAAAMSILALCGVRHQALYFAVAAPFAAHCLAALPEARGLGARRERVLAAIVVTAALGTALWSAFPPASGPLRPRHGGLAWGFGLAPGRFPVGLAERLAQRPAIGPLYNELVHGGYLLWRLHPPRRVFVDGRMELEPKLLREIAAARRNDSDWAEFLARRGAVGALVRYETKPVPILEPDGAGGFRKVGERTANALLFPPERWRLVDWDDDAMLFLERSAAGVDPWPEAPYRYVHPEDLAGTRARAAADPAFRVAALGEVERKLASDPASRRARWLREELQRLP